MNSKAKENAILVGTLQSYCLVCENYLPGRRNVKRHITTQKHIRNMSISKYLDKFPDDRIRRVKKGYYCELCNDYFTTTIQADFHVTDTEHIQNKGFQFLRRAMDNTDMIFYKNVGITKDAWNGIIKNKCVLCNAQFLSKDIHISSDEHLFRLVLIEVEFGIRNGLYRRLRNAFHCLICNEVCVFTDTPQESILMHSLQYKHKVNYNKAELLATQHNNPRESTDETGPSNAVDESPTEDERDDIVSDDEEPTVNEQGASAPLLLDEASNGPPNLGALTISSGQRVEKERIYTFIRNFYAIKGPTDNDKDIVVNWKIVVDYFSFFGFKKTESWKCEICNIILADEEEVENHRISKEHETAMTEVKVIVLESTKDELIREIRSNVYHCGICNITEGHLHDILEHLKSISHKRERISSAWRLHKHTKSA